METLQLLDLIRVLTSIPFLIYSCHSDLRIRRVPNKTWIPLLALGTIYALVEALVLGWEALIWVAISVGVIFSIMYALFLAGAFGGADAKALITLSLILPHYPRLSIIGVDTPVLGQPLVDIFAFGVFGNAVILTVVVPLGLMFYNALRGDLGRYMLIGYRARQSHIEGRHLRLVEELSEERGCVLGKFRRGGVEPTEDLLAALRDWESRGLIDRVWVTPGLPFMIPLTLGFIMAAVYGDLIFLLALLFRDLLI